ncbi:hypothetical protein [Roseateles amylovorans]|uniref:Haemolysin-type calcium binding-related domain-containing protein n=1 Tax=Roseateles amylovorans TaxID=2978473 RepID=A0ABY6AX77_9BURK|nr:hypothetical protein [Roseateles amylovorans]UXH77395.1 hypothetical protein N4261_20675 [Roseateles amylovorans]
MTTQLILFRLSIRSSYTANTEEAATEDEFDTIQFFAAQGSAWRIKTFATDQDVHIWSLDGGEIGDLVELAVSNTEANYGDVLEEGYILDSDTGLDGLREQLTLRGLAPNLKETAFGAAFWTAPGTDYRTRSRPGN